MKPQTKIVLEHLKANGSITNVEAHMVHRIRSVSRRITELHDAGYWIGKEARHDVTGQRYTRYVLMDTVPHGARTLAQAVAARLAA